MECGIIRYAAGNYIKPDIHGKVAILFHAYNISSDVQGPQKALIQHSTGACTAITITKIVHDNRSKTEKHINVFDDHYTVRAFAILRSRLQSLCQFRITEIK